MSFIVNIELGSLADTEKLGSILSEIMEQCEMKLLLLYGSLGAGKTTLVRSLVLNLDCGAEAEVNSPSFTLCNEYATMPKVLHFDLYRSENGTLDEGFLEALDRLHDKEALWVIVEWAERIQPYDHRFFPDEYISCHLTESGNKRTATVAPQGKNASIAANIIGKLALDCGLVH